MTKADHENTVDFPVMSIEDLIARATTEAPVLSHESKLVLQALDMMAEEGQMYPWDVRDVVGVIAGIKPTALISEVNAETGQLLATLGLWQCDKGGAELCVSRDLALADELGVQFRNVREGTPTQVEQTERAIGSLLGYPGTSTDYYIKYRSDEQLPIIIPVVAEGTALWGFDQFIVSPEHWRDELASYAVPLATATAELAPRTYKMFERVANGETPVNVGETHLSRVFTRHKSGSARPSTLVE